MHDLNATGVATLGTLVTAVVFSTTLLSTRVHGTSDRSLGRSIEIGEKLAQYAGISMAPVGREKSETLRPGSDDAQRESGRDPHDAATRSKPPVAGVDTAKTGSSAADRLAMAGLFYEQARVLRSAAIDRLVWLILAMNVFLALFVVGLGGYFASQGGVSVFPPDSGAPSWAVLGFMVAALVVVVVGTIDVITTIGTIDHAYTDTVIGRVTDARKAIEWANERANERAKKQPWSRRIVTALLVKSRKQEKYKNEDEALARAARDAEAAVAGVGEHSAQAWAMRAYVQLSTRELGSLVSPFAVQQADGFLRQAVEIGPATAPIWAAWAYVAELRERDEAAGCRWLEAVGLIARHANIPYPKSFGLGDNQLLYWTTQASTVEPISGAEQQQLTGVTTQRAYAWAFKPHRVKTFAYAVDKLTVDDGRMLFAATQLARAAASWNEDDVNQAVSALEGAFAKSSSPDQAVGTVASAIAQDVATPVKIRRVAERVKAENDRAQNELLKKKFAELDESLKEVQRAAEERRNAIANSIANYGRITELQERMSNHMAAAEEVAEFQALTARAYEQLQQLDAQRNLDGTRDEARSILQRLIDERNDITSRWHNGLATDEDTTRISHLDQEIPDAQAKLKGMGLL